jgi:hypothetical protein
MILEAKVKLCSCAVKLGEGSGAVGVLCKRDQPKDGVHEEISFFFFFCKISKHSFALFYLLSKGVFIIRKSLQKSPRF